MSSSGEEESDEEEIVRYAVEGDASVLSKEARRNARMLEAVMEGCEDAEDADGWEATEEAIRYDIPNEGAAIQEQGLPG
jgi:hypothetical protein